MKGEGCLSLLVKSVLGLAVLFLVWIAVLTVNSGGVRQIDADGSARVLTWHGWRPAPSKTAPDSQSSGSGAQIGSAGGPRETMEPPAAAAPLPTAATALPPVALAPTEVPAVVLARQVAPPVPLPPEPQGWAGRPATELSADGQNTGSAEEAVRPPAASALPWLLGLGLPAGGLGFLGLWGYRRVQSSRRSASSEPARSVASAAPAPATPGTIVCDEPEVDRITGQVVEALDRLGLSHRCQDGTMQRVVICRREITGPGGILKLEIDTSRLPRGIPAHRFTEAKTLHHLSTVVHRPVRVLNGTGLVYAVLLNPDLIAAARLPERIPLFQALRQYPGTPLAFPVGEGPRGPVWVRLDQLDGHFLVGGEPRMGKTTWLKALLLSLTLTCSPAQLRLVLIDPKAVDFSAFADSPHLAYPLAVEREEAEGAIAYLVAELEARRQLFRAAGADKWTTYNARAADRLPYLVAVIDEVAMLIGEKDLSSKLATQLMRLSTLGLTFGICLVLATQKPLARLLGSLTKGNLGVRIAFHVTTADHSRVILDRSGAEQLPRVQGRMKAWLGSGELRELQGYEVQPEDLPQPLRSDPAAFLDGATKRMARYAAEQLGGRFPEREIRQALGVSQTEYRRARDKLLQTGLLTRGDKNALMVASGIVF